MAATLGVREQLPFFDPTVAEETARAAQRHKVTNKASMGSILAAIVAALVSLFIFVQSAEFARAQDQHHDGKVIGGTAVPDAKYPFIAALLNTDFGSTAFQQQFCGGTLIDEDSVLTAAHCVFGE